MHVSLLLNLLQRVGDKASKIASIIRKEKALVDLLVQEKPGIEKNAQFYQDFKTLADVLIQETVRYYISKEIPGIKDSIYGEECNTFTNAVGESIIVEICDTPEETQSLLDQVLSGEDEAAKLLAQAVHSEPPEFNMELSDVPLDIPVQDFGIWIDPIDATTQYIKGKFGEENEHGVVAEGLQCVAILIGMFEKTTGKPVLGLVVQPFHLYNEESQSWSSNTVWGLSYKKEKHTSLSSVVDNSPVPDKLIMSTSESKTVQECLRKKYELMYASGAGYKLLATILGLCKAYVLSHRSIYRWDCCAVHPILKAIGGGIISYKHALEATRKSASPFSAEALEDLQLNYIKAAGAIRNRRNSVSDATESLPGIIAYRHSTDALDILNLLSSAT